MIKIDDTQNSFMISVLAHDGQAILYHLQGEDFENRDEEICATIRSIMTECKQLLAMNKSYVDAWETLGPRNIVLINKPTTTIWFLVRRLIENDWRRKLGNPLL